VATSALVAVLAGGVILNVLKEELPEECRSRFTPFLLGAAAYAGLLWTTADRMKLQTFPARGVTRDDLLPGLRVTHFHKRTIIAYTLETEVVSIVGVFYGGQDYEAALTPNEDQ